MGSREGYLLLGANPLSILLANHLKKQSKICMIDANEAAVARVVKEGFKCIHGNALQEEVMAEAGAGTMDTFIGLTRNTEINILAAQLAKESFQIPNNLIVLTPNRGEGAGGDILEMMNATSIFAAEVDIEFWFDKIASKQYVEEEIAVSERTGTRAWTKSSTLAEEKILPILVMTPNGEKRPFHFGDYIESGEKVIFLK